jgi:hypothetical protein
LYTFLLEGAFGRLCFLAYLAANLASFLAASFALVASVPLEANISSSPKPPAPPKPLKKSDYDSIALSWCSIALS